jgi:hypothetical protein
MEKFHKGRYPGFFNCGSCEVRGTKKHVSKRREKFEAHLSQHGIPSPERYDKFRCTNTPCHDSRLPEGGLFFATQEDLNSHIRSNHTVAESTDETKQASKHSLELSADSLAKRSRPSNEIAGEVLVGIISEPL